MPRYTSNIRAKLTTLVYVTMDNNLSSTMHAFYRFLSKRFVALLGQRLHFGKSLLQITPYKNSNVYTKSYAQSQCNENNKNKDKKLKNDG